MQTGFFYARKFLFPGQHFEYIRIMKYPPFDTFPILSSEKVILRELAYTDTDQLLEIFTYDGKLAETPHEVIEMLDRIDENYRIGEGINWGIVDRETNEIAGTCGYYRGFGNETGEIGFIMRPAFRRKGLMSEALKLAVAYGIEELQLKRVISITKKSNEAALILLYCNSFKFVKDHDSDYREFEYLKA